jgi:predicted CxxxxCH...CXXCH cytochrome family protein
MTLRIICVLMFALLAASCSELRNDISVPVAGGAKIHEAGWNDVAAANFHGKDLKTRSWDDGACKPCHGGDFSGGSSKVACSTCHASYPHSVRFLAAGGGHQGYLRSLNYPLSTCATCHGVSYAGGAIVTKGCQGAGCHVDKAGNPKSPESCNACHGQFDASASLTGVAYLLSAAPPKDVAGSADSTVRGIGAHQRHIATNVVGRTVKCQECHTVPAALNDGGHLGALPAEVVFNDTLARLTTNKGTITPAYAAAFGTCANTFCHGNWVSSKAKAGANYDYAYIDSTMEGANTTVSWTAGAAAGACNSCHGTASPVTYVPRGHIQFASVTSCKNCHTGVTDASGKILDRTKHMNGKINIAGIEKSF